MSGEPGEPHRRRVRYAGTHPRRFAEKYKEQQPERYPETVARVMAAGKTPAGMHRPIMVAEILEVLRPAPGEFAVDCTLGYGGHAEALLARLRPSGRLLALEADPRELPKTVARLEAAGFGHEEFSAHQGNFAGLAKVLSARGGRRADLVLADLGVSSMQLDDPARGFSVKKEGPLDMRLNPEKGAPASALLAKLSPPELAALLAENADEPHAAMFGPALAGRQFATTGELRGEVLARLSNRPEEERELTVRRVFQALRIAVNDEFSALEALLRTLPGCLAPGGRVAILTFHSGEDRRVKKAFAAERVAGVYQSISEEVVRATPAEQGQNPRSRSAKLRWAVRAHKHG